MDVRSTNRSSTSSRFQRDEWVACWFTCLNVLVEQGFLAAAAGHAEPAAGARLSSYSSIGGAAGSARSDSASTLAVASGSRAAAAAAISGGAHLRPLDSLRFRPGLKSTRATLPPQSRDLRDALIDKGESGLGSWLTPAECAVAEWLLDEMGWQLLRITGATLTEDFVTRLGGAAQRWALPVTDLVLSQTSVEVNDKALMRNLMSGLCSQKTLSRLVLCKLKIPGPALAELLLAVSLQHLQELDLSHTSCGGTPDAVKALASVTGQAAGLKQLSLAHSGLKASQLEVILGAVKRPLALECLNLSGSNMSDPELCKLLGSCLALSPCLRTLVLEDCKMDDKGFVACVEAWVPPAKRAGFATRLEVLKLKQNECGALWLRQAGRMFEGVTLLSLKCCSLEQESAAALTAAIQSRSLRSLVTLELAQNLLGDDEVIKLVQEICARIRPQQLELLDLTYNQLLEESVARVRELMATHVQQLLIQDQLLVLNVEGSADAMVAELMNAIESGKESSFMRILSAGGMELLCTPKRHDLFTPLHLIAQLNRLSMAERFPAKADHSLVNAVDWGVMDKRGAIPLHIAAANGHVRMMEFLLQQYPDGCNQQTKDGATPLMLAAACTKPEAVKLLLSRGAQVFLTNRFELNALHVAVTCTNPGSNLDVIELLLAAGTSPNSQSVKGSTALHLAVKRGAWQAAELLLRHGANPTIPNNARLTPIDIAFPAAAAGSAATQLAGYQPSGSSSGSGSQVTLLDASSAKSRAASLLLPITINDKYWETTDGARPHWALFKIPTGMKVDSVQYYCNERLSNNDGAWFPIEWKVEVFPSSGANGVMVVKDLQLRPRAGEQPLASNLGKCDRVKICMHNPTGSNCRVFRIVFKLSMDADGPVSDPEDVAGTQRVLKTWFAEHCVHALCAQGETVAALRLIDRGFLSDEADLKGWTPLIAACHAGALPLVEALLLRKCNVSAAMPDGTQPLHLAVKAGNMQLSDMLLEAGADINSKTDEGE